MKNLQLIMWAFTLSTFSATSFAQSENSSKTDHSSKVEYSTKGKFAIGVDAGGIVPLIGKRYNEVKQAGDISLNSLGNNFIPVSAHIRYYFAERWFANLNYIHIFRNKTTGEKSDSYLATTAPFAGNVGIYANMHFILAGVGYVFAPSKRLKPFVNLDLGMAFVPVYGTSKATGDQVDLGSFATYASSLKVGFDYFFSKHWFLTVKAEYYFISNGKVKSEKSSSEDYSVQSTNLPGINAGISFMF